MSLINDALKRAKRAQKNHPPPPPPMKVPLPAVRPTQSAQSDFTFPILLAMFALLLVAGGIVVFIFLRPSPTTIDRKMPDATPAVQKEGPASAPTAQPQILKQKYFGATSAPPIAATPQPRRNSTASSKKSTVPVLQGIFYRPDNPSAVLNGQAVQPGASVGGFRVLAITQDAVTVGNASQTNVLRLPP